MNKFERNMLVRWQNRKPKPPEPVVKTELTCLDKDSYVEYLEDKVIQLEKELNAAKQKASQRSINDYWANTYTAGYTGLGSITFTTGDGSESGTGIGGL